MAAKMAGRKLGGSRGKYPTAIPTATQVGGAVPASPYQYPYQLQYYQDSAASALWKSQNNSLKTKKVSLSLDRNHPDSAQQQRH